MRLGKKNARVTIMGLGLFGGGAGAARFWANLGAEVTVTDLRSGSELAPALQEIADITCRLVLGCHKKKDFIEADIVVVNPVVKPGNSFLALARRHGAEIITEIGTVFRLLHGPVFGVTGSNGKSTTTALLAEMLKLINPATLAGGNLGGSLLNVLAENPPDSPAVLELSSFQLHYLAEQKIAPNYAIITNLTPNHLDWHTGLEDYCNAKRNILNLQNAGDSAVLNASDPVLKSWVSTCKGRVGLFSLQDPDWQNAAFASGEDIVIRLAGKEKIAFTKKNINLPGRHNLENILAATLGAFMYGKDEVILQQAVSKFKGLPHRLQLVSKKSNLSFYNDSIATTPTSTIAALHSLRCPVVLIAGGYDKGIDFNELAKEIIENCKALVTIGKTGPAIASLVRELSGDFPVKEALNLEDAVKYAKEICPAGGAVVLSPACASYDMFLNFKERGDLFCKLVEQLTK